MRVQPWMTHTPFVEVGRAVRLGAARAQHPVLPLVPVLRGGVDPVGRELVDDEERREGREQVQSLAERIHVMQYATGYDRVPLPLELLERRLYEPCAGRRVRVDAERVVARRREELNEASLAPAPDLEDALRWR